MKLKKIDIFIFFALICIFFVSIFANSKFNESTIDNIEINVLDSNKLNFVDKKEVLFDIEKVCGNISNMQVRKINLNKIKQTLLKNKFVRDVTIYLDVHKSLKINIRQNQPVVRVISKGRSYYINQKGDAFPTSIKSSVNVPLVYGQLTPNNITKLCDWIKNIRKSKWLKKYITAFEIKDNKCKLYTINSKYVIEVGNLENLEKKMKKLYYFYTMNYDDVERGKYKKINIEFNNQVICTKR